MSLGGRLLALVVVWSRVVAPGGAAVVSNVHDLFGVSGDYFPGLIARALRLCFQAGILATQRSARSACRSVVRGTLTLGSLSREDAWEERSCLTPRSSWL